MRLSILLAVLAYGGNSLLAQQTGYGKDCAVRGLAPLLLPSSAIERMPLDLVVENPEALMPTLVWIGASRDKLGSSSLPLALDGLGWPGCSLWTSSEILLGPQVSMSRWATWSLPTRGLPPQLRFYAQAFTFDASLRAHGASRGHELRLQPSAVTTIAMLPDTQFYSEVAGYFRHFVGQTDWLARNARDIAFVTHVGDIVQNGAANAVEWTRADSALSRLGTLPYSVSLGNHDYDVVNGKSAATAYTSLFGPQRYAGRAWCGGATNNGRSHWQVFEDRGRRYLHLNLEWRPDDAVLFWAQDVLRRHAALPAIVSTHEHLSAGLPAARRTSGHTSTTSGDNSGEDVYRKLIEPFPQIFLVLCGHIIGFGKRYDRGVFDNQVLKLLTDYQGEPEGGNGFFRLIELDHDRSQLTVRAMSPTYVPLVSKGTDWSKDASHNFTETFDFTALEARLTRRILRFRNGQDFGYGSYTGTVDTHIGDGTTQNTLPDRSYASSTNCWCDGDADHEQALLRFDGIVGTGPGQVAPRTKLRRAVLTLTSEGSNAQSSNGGRVHRLLRAWQESSTWNEVGAGIQVGSEALAMADFDSRGLVSTTGTRSFDVTASVQAFVDGAPNYGWVFVCNGNDGWSFRSSEWPGIVERPLLSIEID